MKKRIAATAFLMLAAWAQPGMACDDAVVALDASVTGRLVLDVIDGKAQAALVSMPLEQAVAAARETAWSEGRILGIPEFLVFHEVAGLRNGNVPVGFVTVGEPKGAVAKVLANLR